MLRGGQSSERAISLSSGAAVAAALKRQGYEVVELDSDQTLGAHLQRQSPTSAEPIDVAFIALHGRGGEDGRIQGLLEWAGIPYTGSGVLASALAMNKAVTKQLLQADGIPTPPYRRIHIESGVAPSLDGIERFPVVVKPTSEGSTVGVSIVRDASGLAAAVAEASRFGADLLIEEFIEGHELTVALLDGVPLPPIEIVPKEAFYNYEAKYISGRCDYRLPPTSVSAEVCQEAQRLAERVHRLLGCCGATRVDFRVDPQGMPCVLELNTVPGMTETSLLPKAAAAAGIDYDTLVVRILASASRQSGTRD